jgi:hypothetical protein
VMAWADVLVRLKFWDPNSSPPVVNGVEVATRYQTGVSFLDGGLAITGALLAGSTWGSGT